MKEILMTFLMAMVPVIELRGAIPYGVLQGLSIGEALAVSIAGNLAPIPVLIVFTRRVFEWLKGKSTHLNRLVLKLEAKAESKKETVEKWEFLGLVVLVAIPLPGTGAWTGALVAAMMDMRLKRAFPAVVIGVIIAGIIVSAVTFGVDAII
ncbi:MAG: small multi-drug export protein [Firmicutes bacterium]|nr:small multi-drug export protein [Bacillota bacterium]